MRRDPHTGAPDFFQFARDYLHAYMPKTRGLSPKTIEAYRISLECFLDYLAEAEHIGREHVSFDHFDRQHLKGWLTWMTDQRHYTPKTVTLRLSAVKAFLTYAAYEDHAVALSQSAKALKAPAGPRRPIEYLTEAQTRAILAAFTGQTAKSRRNRMLLILLYDTAARGRDHRPDPAGSLPGPNPHILLTGKGNKTRVVPLTDENRRAPARLPRRVPPEHRQTPRDQAVVLQSAPRATCRTVRRHGRRRAQASCRIRTCSMPFDPAEHPLPPDAQNQRWISTSRVSRCRSSCASSATKTLPPQQRSMPL